MVSEPPKGPLWVKDPWNGLKRPHNMIREWFEMSLKHFSATIFDTGKLKPEYMYIQNIIDFLKSRLFVQNKYSLFKKSRISIQNKYSFFWIPKYSFKIFIFLKSRIFIQKNIHFFYKRPYRSPLAVVDELIPHNTKPRPSHEPFRLWALVKLSEHITNIAKGTTDPGAECCWMLKKKLPKQAMYLYFHSQSLVAASR